MTVWKTIPLEIGLTLRAGIRFTKKKVGQFARP
jgi:hypothetical protein